MSDSLPAAVLDNVPLLFEATQRGDIHGAMVAMRRFLGRVATVDPDLAAAIKGRLSSAQGPSVSRGAASPSRGTVLPSVVSADAPRDGETQSDLLRRTSLDVVTPPVLGVEANGILQALLLEHRRRDELARVGLAPRMTMLLVGPPGVGKTMTAGWLASQLGLPMYELEMPALISSYLGRTGQNLREVFDFARRTPAVILMDEFDGIAKKREDHMDLGEARRIVNVLLKEIEEWPGPSVLVAATNHASLVDPAVFRRFQVVLTLEPPDANQARDMLRIHLTPVEVSQATLRLGGTLLKGVSGSDIRELSHECRRAIALDSKLDPEEALLRMLGARARTPSARREFARTAKDVVPDVSLSMIARWLGVSKASIHSYTSPG